MLEQRLAEVEDNKESGTIFLRLKDVLLSVMGVAGVVRNKGKF